MSRPTPPDPYHDAATRLLRMAANRACQVCGEIPRPRLSIPFDWLDQAEVTIDFVYACRHQPAVTGG